MLHQGFAEVQQVAKLTPGQPPACAGEADREVGLLSLSHFQSFSAPLRLRARFIFSDFSILPPRRQGLLVFVSAGSLFSVKLLRL
jgi:hypothetical protein